MCQRSAQIVHALAKPGATRRTAESFFNRDRLPAKLLLRLYQHELSMLNSIAFLSMEINSVPQQTRIEQVEEQFAHIRT
jgi:hypothetical protein